MIGCHSTALPYLTPFDLIYWFAGHTHTPGCHTPLVGCYCRIPHCGRLLPFPLYHTHTDGSPFYSYLPSVPRRHCRLICAVIPTRLTVYYYVIIPVVYPVGSRLVDVLHGWLLLVVPFPIALVEPTVPQPSSSGPDPRFVIYPILIPYPQPPDTLPPPLVPTIPHIPPITPTPIPGLHGDLDFPHPTHLPLQLIVPSSYPPDPGWSAVTVIGYLLLRLFFFYFDLSPRSHRFPHPIILIPHCSHRTGEQGRDHYLPTVIPHLTDGRMA